MSNTTMKMSSVTDYILKLEKLNEESRTKIEHLKKMLIKESEDKVNALNELNDMNCKSLYHKTAYPFENEKKSVINEGLVDFLIEFANEASDFYKAAAYRRAAGIVKNLSYEVESGQSLLNINGIGKSIASKIDEYIEDEDSDYTYSDTDSDESIASNDDGDSIVSELTDYDVDTDEEYFVSYNHDIYDMLCSCADEVSDRFKKEAYFRAADAVYHLPFRIKNAKDLADGPKKVIGIGQSVARKIDHFLKKDINTSLVKVLTKLGNLEPAMYKSEAYWNAAEKIRDLDYTVTSGNDVSHLRGFGTSICNKINEFLDLGTISRLEELSK
tara:strand:+ start:405 stop:1388 length:984 start_codon:yes stop_codon:yes gene_type:complete